MEDLMNDFVKAEIVDLDVDGKIYKYRPVTAGEENSWLHRYMKTIDGKPVQDYSELNKCMLQNIIEVPYPSELIKNITGINKPWSVMNQDERWELFAKLKPDVFTKLIYAIRDCGKDETKKKNSSNESSNVTQKQDSK